MGLGIDRDGKMMYPLLLFRYLYYLIHPRGQLFRMTFLNA